jgi:hypothetical protein
MLGYEFFRPFGESASTSFRQRRTYAFKNILFDRVRLGGEIEMLSSELIHFLDRRFA